MNICLFLVRMREMEKEIHELRQQVSGKASSVSGHTSKSTARSSQKLKTDANRRPAATKCSMLRIIYSQEGCLRAPHSLP